MNLISSKQIVADAGSTKSALCSALEHHSLRGRFVATHPMWGTEYSGPKPRCMELSAAAPALFAKKEKNDADALQTVENIYHTLGMHLVYMNAEAHDVHAAYVSHISHITSFALANTVLEKRTGRRCNI